MKKKNEAKINENVVSKTWVTIEEANKILKEKITKLYNDNGWE